MSQLARAAALLPSWIGDLRWPVVNATWISVLVAGVLLFVPSSYASRAVLLPPEAKQGGGLGSLAAAAATFGMGLGLQGGPANNNVEIITSRWMGEKILDSKFTFKMRKWRFGETRTYSQTLFEYFQVKTMDEAMSAYLGMVSARTSATNGITEISVETNASELSQQVLARILENLEKFINEHGRTRGGQKAIFTDNRLKEAKQEALAAEDAFRAFMDRNRNYRDSPDPRTRLQGIRLEGELQLRRQLVATLAMNREQALLEEKNDIPFLNILDPGARADAPSRPARGRITRLAFLLVLIGNLGMTKRKFVREKLLGQEG